MSYRDLRNFAEMMRAVGYRRVISLENFKNPNFPLLCEILKWLLAYFDPDVFFPVNDPQMCSERVKFINFAAEFMLTKVNVKVNPKKLYEANGYAIKELLKIVSVLFDEMKQDNLLRCTKIDDNIAIYIDDKLIEKDSSGDYNNDECDRSDDDETYALLTNLASRTDELREARLLVKNLTEKAAILYFTIDREVDLYNKRMLSLTKHFNIEEVEDLIEGRIKVTTKETLESMNLLGQMTSDKIRLEEKFEKKVLEMERCIKRYDKLKNIKPVYLKDFEIAEVEFGELYEDYLEKYKNMAFLESISSKYDAIEKQCKEMAANKMKIKMMKSNAAAPLSTTATNLIPNFLVNGPNERKISCKNPSAANHKDSDKTSISDQQQHRHQLTDLFLIKGTDKVPISTNSDFFTDKNEDEDDNDDEEDDDDDDEDCDDDPFYNDACYDLSGNNANNNQHVNDFMKSTDEDDDDDYDFSKTAAMMMMMDKYGNTSAINNLPGVHQFEWNNPLIKGFGFPGDASGGIPPHPYFKNNKRFGGNTTMVPEDDDDDEDNF